MKKSLKDLYFVFNKQNKDKEMEKLPVYYVDGIAKSYQNEGTIRMEFFTIEEENSKMSPRTNVKLLTSVSGFLRTFQVMSDTVKKMEEQGVIKKKEDSDKGEKDSPKQIKSDK